MYLSAGIQKFQSLFLQLFDPAYNARAMPAVLTKDRRELPPELFGRVMTAGHKHHRFIFLDWHRAPDGHLFGKDVFSGKEISSQQTEPIYILPCPVQQQPSGLQGEQLCRVIRAANFCPFRALWCFQFPTGLAFAPAFPAVAQQRQVQHQGLVQIITLCLNKTDLAQPPGSYGRKSLSFWLCGGVIIAVHAQQPPRRLRIVQLFLALPRIQRKEPEFIAAFRHFTVEFGRTVFRADLCLRHLPEGCVGWNSQKRSFHCSR